MTLNLPDLDQRIISHVPYNLVMIERLSKGNACVSGAGGLRLKSWACRIGHSVANGPPLLPTTVTFLWKDLCCSYAQGRGDGPIKLVTRFGVIHAASIMKDMI